MANNAGVLLTTKYIGMNNSSQSAEMTTPSGIRFGHSTSTYGDIWYVTILKFTVPTIGQSEALHVTVSASDDSQKYSGSRSVKWAISKSLIKTNPNGGTFPSSTVSTGTWSWAIDTQKLVSTDTKDISTTVLSAGDYYFYLWGSDLSCTIQSATIKLDWNSTYTIRYDANGGSGAPSNQTKVYGKSLTLSATKPTNEGYKFVKWNTAKNGSGTSYASGATYTANSSVTLYAIWELVEYTLTITSTNASVTVERTSSPIGGGEKTTLSSGAKLYLNDVLKITFSVGNGYELSVHKVNGTSFASGSSHTVSGDVMVSATGTAIAYTLSISSSSGVTATVQRTSSPIGGGATGNIANGATIYYNDALNVTFTPATGYSVKTKTVNGSNFTSGSTYTAKGNVSVVGAGQLITHTISISNSGGATATVKRTSSPIGGGATGNLANNAVLYINDVLQVSFSASPGYEVKTHTVNGNNFNSGSSHTVSGDVSVVTTGGILGSVSINGEMYLVYIDNGTSFSQYVPYADDGSAWKICSTT